jgi:hypothetical protein
MTHFLQKKVGRLLRLVSPHERFVQSFGDEYQAAAHKGERRKRTRVRRKCSFGPTKGQGHEASAEPNRKEPRTAIKQKCRGYYRQDEEEKPVGAGQLG